MNDALQVAIVAIVVGWAGGYAAIKLMPKAWRASVATTAAAWTVRAGLSDVAARRVEAKLSSGGACGSCDSCKACATTPVQASGARPTIPIRRAR